MLAAVLIGGLASVVGPAGPAAAANYVPITGSGSTWSYNAFHAWTNNVAQYGMHIDYARVGSTTGRSNFREGTVDFAASDIPYGVKDGTSDDPPPPRGYVYMPDTAGGTTLMYNLKIGTSRVTNLRLSGTNVAKIFTGVLTKWNDPAIAADNPGLTLPAIKIVPVVRSDGSGSTAQFTQWMIATQGSYWTAYCGRVGRNPCTQTSAYPVLNGSGMVGQNGDLGVSGYISQAAATGTIGYVEYSYAIQAGFPVAKVLNTAGYYTEPTPGHVAVSLLAAQINMDKSNRAAYLTQDLSHVYTNPDSRTYELSSYSYMILPTTTDFGFTTARGLTLGDFGNYVLCQGQAQVDSLGYSALPINLVQAGFGQLQTIPGAHVPTATTDIIRSCNNPTFSTDGTNTLAKNDPHPPSCDKQGPTQCTTGTGGAQGSTSTSNGNGGNGGNGANGTNPGGSASASASAGAGADPNVACDPDSGTCGGGANAANAADQINGTPVNAAADFHDGLGIALMAVAVVLLIGLVLVPPLIAQSARNRQARRDGTGGVR
jgi:phosphate ABC transporter phosphate-binding protein